MEEPLVNKLNIYLVKPEISDINKIIKPGIERIELEQGAIFAKESSYVRPPDWISKFFGVRLGGELNILTSSAKAVLLIPVQRNGILHSFAVPFGAGRFLLQDGVLEERFGLRVVLNSVDSQNIRGIDKTSLSSVPKHSNEQMSADGVASDFGIDIEQDLIRAVTGKSKIKELGKNISGKDALSISAKVDITNIFELLAICIDLNNSREYKREFGWVDQIAEVKNKSKIESLNTQMLEKLNNRDIDHIWMAVPEVIDWHDIRGFKYQNSESADEFEDLSLIAFLDTIQTGLVNLQSIKSRRIYSFSAERDDIGNTWSAYSCIYAEIPDGKKVFILNNGKWYEIEEDFVDSINSDFNSMEESKVELLDYQHENEGSYNEDVAKNLGYILMDKKNINYGGGKSLIEFCDLFKGNTLVHVKKYGGSNVLSHLFSQGTVSGEVFVSDSEFRAKLNELLPSSQKFVDPSDRPLASDYEVVYAIISKSADPLSLPFFSKVSLRNAKRRLEGFGYRVTIKKIQQIQIDSS
jgi:uncharacterized protein (TIGR04141 family)